VNAYIEAASEIGSHVGKKWHDS